ncbi:uroporphyrinogen-III synthase [Fulvimarina sp. MAC8]|uniref:uroporphyrinogen-III synthase n=1 Tax=Fulvimarina sp. MAC8 TaxID=3162874 RepID=UPI0032EE7CE2
MSPSHEPALMARVLVLREEGAAERTADQLRALGHEPLLLPLEAVIRLDNELPVSSFDGFVVTSAQAVPALAEAFADDARPVFAVGEATGEALESAGFSNVQVGSGKAASLPCLVESILGAPADGTRLLYAAGRNRSGSLEEAVAGTSLSLSTWEVYDIVRRVPDLADLDQSLGDTGGDAALILSQAQAAAFADCVMPYLGAKAETLRLLCLSERIAEALPSDLRSRVEISGEPKLASLFERL